MKGKTKLKGFVAVQAILLCVVVLMAGYSLAQIYGSQFSALSASRKALQAQQFAQSEADLLRNTSYDELDAAAHDRQAITGVNGWMSEVSIEAETTINDVPQRLATVKVYRNGTVTAPDFSLKVPLSSASGGDTFPVGTILPYKGTIANIPKNWALCDGSNGTPDLRRRFLEGNDMSETFEFKEAALPNIRGRGNGYLLGADGVTTSSTTSDGSFITVSSDIHGIYGGVNTVRKVLYLDASLSSDIYKDACTTVQPPAFTVMYIIKIK